MACETEKSFASQARIQIILVTSHFPTPPSLPHAPVPFAKSHSLLLPLFPSPYLTSTASKKSSRQAYPNSSSHPPRREPHLNLDGIDTNSPSYAHAHGQQGRGEGSRGVGYDQNGSANGSANGGGGSQGYWSEGADGDEDGEEEEDEEAKAMAAMGFGGFASTKVSGDKRRSAAMVVSDLPGERGIRLEKVGSSHSSRILVNSHSHLYLSVYSTPSSSSPFFLLASLIG